MKNPRARANRRAKVIELSLFLLEHEPNGIRASDLSKLIGNAVRFRCSPNTLGQILMSSVRSGTLEKFRNVEGNSVYRYILPSETETYGVET